MLSFSKRKKSVTATCIIVVILGNLLPAQCFGEIFSRLSLARGKSLGELARQKIADLHNLRAQLEQKMRNSNDNNNNNGVYSTNSYPVQSHVNFKFKNETARVKGSKNKAEERIVPTLPNPLPMPGLWTSFKSIFSMKKSRDGFLARILPNAHVLRKIIKMRKEMDPSLYEYLTSKYNNFLTTLIPYSDNIGIPSYVLNSMKVSGQDQDSRWQYIEKLLETSTVAEVIQTIPDFSSLFTNTNNKNGGEPSNSLHGDENDSYEPLQSRTDEQDLVSDQEPDAVVKGHKKKYSTSYGIRLGSRRHRPHKGDLAAATSAATSSSSSTAHAGIGPERTGYEYSAYADQYGLYGHDSYDTYGGDTKGTDHGTSYGHGGSGHKGGGHGHGSSSSSYGHSTYYSPKSYGGHSSGGYGHSGGGGGYGHGGGGGHGMMGGFLDPFSILGTLAFLTYLGLLFQQSMTPNNMNMTGRGLPDDSDPIFGRRKKSIELTVLNFNTDNSEDSSKENDRHIRSLEGAFTSTQHMDTNILEDTWREINDIQKIEEDSCRQEKFCQLIQDIGHTDLMNIFKEVLERRKKDRKYLRELYYKSKTNEGITCGLRISLDCDYKND